LKGEPPCSTGRSWAPSSPRARTRC
jgi:hypothetical protein